jgi:allophanate hydrolase subunit 2
MGLRANIIQGLEKYGITKIEGQPTEEDLTQLTLELSNALGSVATTLGGGEHGHVGMIIGEAESVTFSRNGVKFVTPTNPGVYPASPNADAVIQEQQIAEHKTKQDKFITHQAIEAFARQVIASAVESEWLAEIKSDTMGYNHVTPKKMLSHFSRSAEHSTTWTLPNS